MSGGFAFGRAGSRRAAAPRGRAGRRGLAVGLLAVAALAGCTVGPDFQAQTPPAGDRYGPERLRSPGGQRFVVGAAVPDRWWRAFRSPALDALVERSLAANPSIEAARAAVRLARDNAFAQQATAFPQLGLDAVASRQRTSVDLSQPLSYSTRYTYNLFTPALGLTFNPDLFGGNRRQVENLEALAESESFTYENARLNLETSVVAAAVQEASLRGQLDATRRVIGLQKELLGLVRRQAELGQASELEVEQQAALLAQSQQLEGPLAKQLAQQRNLLTALAGQLPSDEVGARFTFASLRLPAALPVSLPGAVVRNRPDVRAAEARLHAASAAVGVAVANRFPQLTLTANGGLSAARIASLATPGAQFYTVASTLAQPIFDAGLLAFRQDAAQEGFNQADALYRSTVIGALQNVADALRALQADAGIVSSARAGAEAARRSVDLARRQLAAGGRPERDPAARPADLPPGADRRRPGAGDPLRRHGGALPGARRRLVAAPAPARRSGTDALTGTSGMLPERPAPSDIAAASVIAALVRGGETCCARSAARRREVVPERGHARR